MSDEKQPVEAASTLVRLVAVERGFRDGAMVHPGQTFLFDLATAKKDAKGEPRLPKWAQLATKPLPPPKRAAGDLKPKAAQAAVKVKAGQLAGNSPDPLA
jgi:hypothetical protein